MVSGGTFSGPASVIVVPETSFFASLSPAGGFSSCVCGCRVDGDQIIAAAQPIERGLADKRPPGAVALARRTRGQASRRFMRTVPPEAAGRVIAGSSRDSRRHQSGTNGKSAGASIPSLSACCSGPAPARRPFPAVPPQKIPQPPSTPGNSGGRKIGGTRKRPVNIGQINAHGTLGMVEPRRFELLTPTMPLWCSTN